MAEKRREEQENLEALERLRKGAENPPRPVARTVPSSPPQPDALSRPKHVSPALSEGDAAAKARASAAAPTQPNTVSPPSSDPGPFQESRGDARSAALPPPALPPLNLPAAASSAAAPTPSPRRVRPPAEGEPAYRCLNCGYPIAEDGELRCTECGRTYDQDVLETWFSGEEQARFEHVIWLVVAILFVKLILLQQLLKVARVAGAGAIAWSSHVASRGKPAGPGRFYAIAGMVVAGLMLFASFWDDALPYYTLDMIGGCVLLLSMLNDATGERIGGVTLGRRLAPAILFAAPVFGLGCYVFQSTVGTQLAAATGTIGGPGPYSPFDRLFDFVIPFFAAAAVWVFVWRALAGMRKLLFGSSST